jgi:NADH:ubiquinone oxidoreductase subunit F (NADH-binding)
VSLPRLLGAEHGPLPRCGPELIEAAELAGLRGRGGAGFPTAVKLRGVAQQRGPRTVLVNGAEGEPMSAKDRVLMEVAPQLVLDGAMAAAAAVDAREIVVAVREDAIEAISALRRAVAQRPSRPKVTVDTVPIAFLAGEETALIRRLDGGPLKPTVTPPLPFERGLRRRPTLVQNPETLAHLALIARHDPRWFREVGTESHPGSTLVTVGGAVERPGVLEIACGAPLDDVLAAAGSTPGLRAVLVGGFHGTWILATESASVRLDDAGLARHGGRLGAGVVVALPKTACPVQELSQTVAWLAGQSAGQCGPCSNGLPAIAELLDAVAAGQAPAGWRERLERWSADVTGRGACHLPDGAMRFLASGLRVFAGELADHERHGACDACHRPPTLAVSGYGRRLAA